MHRGLKALFKSLKGEPKTVRDFESKCCLGKKAPRNEDSELISYHHKERNIKLSD